MGLKDRALALLGRQKSSVNATPPSTWPVNWFQRGWTPEGPTKGGSVVEACVSAYAQTVAQLPGRHYRITDNGTKEYVTTSNLARVLAKPNSYQTRSDFLLNLVYSLYTNGNAYWIGNQNGTEKPTEIFLLDPNATRAHRVEETGDVFYSTSGEFANMSEMTQGDRVMIPERYVGHLRLHTPRDPLIGVTPVENAAASVAANESIVNHQSSFFRNMSRPSGLISTDMELTAAQMGELRKAWEEHSKDLNSGGVPILGGGMKWQSMSLASQDAQLVEAWRMTVEDISRVFRVPPMLINNMENSTFQNSETLMRFWLASGLGFLINHIELAFSSFYNLDNRTEGVELDQEVLLRSDTQAQMEALGTGVTKGLMAPNEGRKRLGLSPVDGGDMPLVQTQMIPVNLAADPDRADMNPINGGSSEPDAEPEEDVVVNDEERAYNRMVLGLSEYRNAA
jgi:HK97 family phage portal protein